MISILPLAAMAAALVVAPVSDRGTMETRTMIVPLADLDLTHDRDVRTLDGRIARAAQQVCGEAASWDLHGTNTVRRCRSDTIASLALDRDRVVADVRNLRRGDQQISLQVRRPGMSVASQERQ